MIRINRETANSNCANALHGDLSFVGFSRRDCQKVVLGLTAVAQPLTVMPANTITIAARSGIKSTDFDFEHPTNHDTLRLHDNYELSKNNLWFFVFCHLANNPLVEHALDCRYYCVCVLRGAVLVFFEVRRQTKQYRRIQAELNSTRHHKRLNGSPISTSIGLPTGRRK